MTRCLYLWWEKTIEEPYECHPHNQRSLLDMWRIITPPCINNPADLPFIVSWKCVHFHIMLLTPIFTLRRAEKIDNELVSWSDKFSWIQSAKSRVRIRIYPSPSALILRHKIYVKPNFSTASLLYESPKSSDVIRSHMAAPRGLLSTLEKPHFTLEEHNSSRYDGDISIWRIIDCSKTEVEVTINSSNPMRKHSD